MASCKANNLNQLANPKPVFNLRLLHSNRFSKEKAINMTFGPKKSPRVIATKRFSQQKVIRRKTLAIKKLCMCGLNAILFGVVLSGTIIKRPTAAWVYGDYLGSLRLSGLKGDRKKGAYY